MCVCPLQKKKHSEKQKKTNISFSCGPFFSSSENTQVTAAAADIGSSELVGCPGDGWEVPMVTWNCYGHLEKTLMN